MAPLTRFGVEEGHARGEQRRHGHGRHELLIAVVRGEGHRALAQVGEALGQSDHEQVVRVLRVVLGQLTQHCGQSAKNKVGL